MAKKRKASPRPAADSKRRSGGLGARRGEPEPEEEEEGECGREGGREAGRALRHRRGLGPVQAAGVSEGSGSSGCPLALSAALGRDGPCEGKGRYLRLEARVAVFSAVPGGGTMGAQKPGV